MKKLAVLVLVLSVLGSVVFAQGLPRGATAWEYATLVVTRPPGNTENPRFNWLAYGVPNGITGNYAAFVPALARQYQVDYEAVRENMPSGVPFVLNVAGFAGWELLSYTMLPPWEVEFVFKRPRP